MTDLITHSIPDRKYIFIDRDGVTNVRPPKGEYVCDPVEFIWLPGAKEAIKKLNDAGFFIIMITNQAGIAKGLMTEVDFYDVQKKMMSDLSDIDAHIDDVFFCPHGPDDGCECRKPKPGMLFEAQIKYAIDLSKCILIGDDVRDIITAHNAHMRGILITDEYQFSDAVNDVLNGIIKNYEVNE